MESALYSGWVRHTRLRPVHHDFRYRVYYGLFDIDRLDELDQRLRLFSVGRFNLHGIDIADHGPADGSPLRPWVEGLLARAGVDLDGGQILLLALPRILGYVFNPLSVWYCHGPGGDLRAVLHEVRNTFGDRHTYVVPIGPLRHTATKQLHVSPFNDMDQTYHFSINEPENHLAIAIGLSDGRGMLFRAGMSLSRRPLTDRGLLTLAATHPLVTLKVIGGIHWQALRLWIKGAGYRRRPRPPVHEVTILEQERAAA